MKARKLERSSVKRSEILLNDLYNEFSVYIARGHSIAHALTQFTYLHPIMLARLEKRVYAIYPSKAS